MKKYTLPLFLIIVLFGCKNKSSDSDKTFLKDSTGITKEKETDSTSGQSIFVIADTFQTQHNKNITLSSLAGKPTVVAMIFTNCGFACPRITSDMVNIADSLKENRNKVNFVLISFDIARDTPAQLQKFAKKMALDSNWILLHGSEQVTRTVSVLLNVQYEKDAEGNFSHSNLISVLDKNGVLNFQKEGLEADHKETIDKINALLK